MQNRRLMRDDARMRWVWRQSFRETAARVWGYEGCCTCVRCLGGVL
jgi:hypothetical protein